MKQHFLPYLSDPETRALFSLLPFKKNGDEVVAGILQTKTSWYPIINSVPRILIGELKKEMLQAHHEFFKQYSKELPKEAKKEWQQAIDAIENFDAFVKHQSATAHSFAYEWKTIYKESDFEKNNFYHFAGPYIKEGDCTGQVTLDIGCGSGRFTKQAALAGAKVAFATDLGESVEVAYEMNKNYDNVCVIQADIYAMPFYQTIDIAYSIGVLHHLPQPKQGFLSLPKVLKPGGRMVIWVYNRRNNARALYFYEPIRSVLKQLPKPVLYRLSYIPGGIVHLINYMTHFLNKVGAKKAALKVPFSYYANFPFNMKLNDAFDVLATPKSNYYYKEEIENWYHEGQLKHIESFEHPEAGITCNGTYEG